MDKTIQGGQLKADFEKQVLKIKLSQYGTEREISIADAYRLNNLLDSFFKLEAKKETPDAKIYNHLEEEIVLKSVIKLTN
jgi:hypothetical protein